MLLTLKDKEGKSVYTHTSLLEEEKVEKIQEVFHRESTWKNRGTFFTAWGLLELVNRVPLIAKQRLEYRVAGVALPLLLISQWAVPKLYWTMQGNSQIKKLCAGAPVYDTAAEVPEIDKLYFFLDDDHHYEPSLWHHGTFKPVRPKKYYNDA
mmetsp:Transcript_50910/g.58527  ORF Transcript_50910/g.58527 Transcript_50910/m.58527 type:complete len:152 (-) Transcript_50910:202-657(-)